jgi:hypothetical protein
MSTISSAATRSPHDFLLLYRNLDVDLVDGTTARVDVHEYRNAEDYWKAHNWAAAWNKHPEKHDGEHVTADEYWDDPAHKHHIGADHDVSAGLDDGWPPLAARLKRKSKSRGDRSRVVTVARKGSTPFTEDVEDLIELYGCYQGKGTPEAVAQALRLANVCGLVEGTRDALQHYCDGYIGLDCSGFVGNYLRTHGNTDFGPSTSANGFAPDGKRVKKLAEVRDLDVFCWTNEHGNKGGGHVAIIDKIDSVSRDDKGEAGEVVAWVAESCGSNTVSGDVHTDGLNYTQYVILPPNKHDVYKVARAHGWEKAGGWKEKIGHLGWMWVHIARLL